MNEKEKDQGITRRQAIVAGLAGATTLAALPSLVAGQGSKDVFTEKAEPNPGKTRDKGSRMPVVYLPHGGGPWPFVDIGMPKAEVLDLSGYLRSLRDVPNVEPKALLVVSAHWEEDVPTVMTAEQPPMYYDYYGFPPASYQITWPAPGSPALAARVRELLGAAGFETAAHPNRGYDHGTFVPLKLTYPEAKIPTVQLSLKTGLDPAEHLAMGRALAPLRDEGIFIVGSGMSFHNMRGFRAPGTFQEVAETFDVWLRETMALDADARDGRLIEWASAPSARLSHPREEHLLPLMVIAGAAGQDRGSLAYNGKVFGLRLSAYHFS